MEHPADRHFFREQDRLDLLAIAREQAAEEITEALLDGETIRLGTQPDLVLCHTHLLEHLDVPGLLAAYKHAQTGSHAQAVRLLTKALNAAAVAAGEEYADLRLAYLQQRAQEV